MNMNQAAKKWNVTKKTVHKYCEEGMVPFAEQDGSQWSIPDECEKPPVTRSGACLLMSFISLYEEGGNPTLRGTGISKASIESSYEFISAVGFIGEMSPGNTLKERLKGVGVTSWGKNLIDAENNTRRQKRQIEITAHFNFVSGPIDAGVQVNYRTQESE